MSTCTDLQCAAMIHAYEIGLLSDDEKQQMEVHMFECEHCFKEVTDFLETSRLLNHDPDFRPDPSEFSKAKSIEAEEADGSSETSSKPEKSAKFGRMLLIAASIVLVLLAISINEVWLPSGESDIVQRLELLPLRSGVETRLYLDKGGEAEISFALEDAVAGEGYRVTVTDSAGLLVFVDDSFDEFNNTGLGTVTILVSKFHKGQFELQIQDLITQQILHKYCFIVK